MSGNDIYSIVTNPCLEKIKTNLSVFIENINCLKETFGYSEGMLKKQLCEAEQQYMNHVGSDYSDSCEYGKLNIQCGKKVFDRCVNKIQRAKRAGELIYPSFVVSLVSVFDTYLAGLVRIVYDLNDSLYMDSNMKFLYRDLKDIDSVSEVKRNIVDSTIDKLFRDSHVEQIKWFEKVLKLKLTEFSEWPDYVELTERRNLFVHSDGVVSTQYLKVCDNHKCNVHGLEVGNKLSVDKSYFEKSYRLLFFMGVNLTQVVMNVLYNKAYENGDFDRDRILITCVYDLICEKQYEIAIQVSESARANYYKHAEKEELYIKLNLAQAYKWSGKKEECDKILNNIDTSALHDSLLIPILVLRDQFEQAYAKMQSLGADNEILNKEAYSTWPIFKEIRKKDKFQDMFENLFNESMNYNDGLINTNSEDRVYDDRTISS